MKVLILGADGYLGWPTCMYLSIRGHEVFAIDSYHKRQWEIDVGVKPLVKTHRLSTRCAKWAHLTGNEIKYEIINVSSPYLIQYVKRIKPDVIIHYAEQPSAPYSMIGDAQCIETQMNNVHSTLNVLWAIKDTDTHLIKLGTMGEYGTPNIPIEEGWLEVNHGGRKDRMLYPKKPGSWYHASKVHDSANIEMACRLWGIRATDLNQGIVYGVHTDETLLSPDLETSFHYDSIFGTAINRFVTQAATENPITIYGNGSQTRGWLNIRDTMQCVELALLNPPEAGEFRVFNQFTQQFSVGYLAKKVADIMGVSPQHIDNPRIEDEDHFYDAEHSSLYDLGLEPVLLTEWILSEMISYVQKHRKNVDKSALMPGVKWK